MGLIVSKHWLLWVAVVDILYVETVLAQSSATSTAAESRNAAEPVTETKKSNRNYRGDVLRLGGFFITNISTKLGVSARGKPIGGIIDLNDDLGAEDSVVSPRIAGSYRFNKRHGITFGYYKLDLARSSAWASAAASITSTLTSISRTTSSAGTSIRPSPGCGFTRQLILSSRLP